MAEMAVRLLLLLVAFCFQEVIALENCELTLENEMPPCTYNGPPGDTKKLCVFRNDDPTPEMLFGWAASYGCFIYIPPKLRKQGVPPPRMRDCHHDGASVKSFLLIQDNRTWYYPISSQESSVVEEVRRTLVSEDAVRRWIRCEEAAKRCCHFMDNSTVYPENSQCPSTWDAWTCWAPGQPGVSSQAVCTEFAYSNSGPTCDHFSSRVCNSNGIWVNDTIYSACSVTPRLKARASFHIICLGVSVAFGLPAIIILLVYPRLRARRLALHRNVLIAVVLRNVFVIITKSVIILEELSSSSGHTIMAASEFGCKLLVVCEKLAASASFTCMLVDGIFLHKMIVVVFNKNSNIKLIYGLAIGATVIPVVIWICLMSTLNDHSCWLVYTTSGLQWALDAPRIIMLIVNTILLVDILRVLLTKLRRKENNSQLSTTKATLFLMPLFGVQFVLTAWKPPTNDCAVEQGYYFFTYVMDALQGITVAILYCYWNKEVHKLIKETYRKVEIVVSEQFQGNVARRLTRNVTNKRETLPTMIHDHIDSGSLNQKSQASDNIAFSHPASDEVNLPQDNETENQPVTHKINKKTVSCMKDTFSKLDDPSNLKIKSKTIESEKDIIPIFCDKNIYASEMDSEIDINDTDTSPNCSLSSLSPIARGINETETSVEKNKCGNLDYDSDDTVKSEDVNKDFGDIGKELQMMFSKKDDNNVYFNGGVLNEGFRLSSSSIEYNDCLSIDILKIKSADDNKNGSRKNNYDINTQEQTEENNNIDSNEKQKLPVPYSSNVYSITDPISCTKELLLDARDKSESFLGTPQRKTRAESTNKAKDLKLLEHDIEATRRLSNLSLPSDIMEDLDSINIFDNNLRGIEDYNDDRIKINASQLCPNRPEGDKIIFID